MNFAQLSRLSEFFANLGIAVFAFTVLDKRRTRERVALGTIITGALLVAALLLLRRSG